MEIETGIWIFKDYLDKYGRVIPGRKHFLAENGLTSKPDELFHAVSYFLIEQNKTIIEIFIDQIAIAAAASYPQTFMETAEDMIIEELLGQLCLLEIKYPYPKTPGGHLLIASIIDPIIANILGKSYSQEIRKKSAYRIFRQYPVL